MCIRDSSWTSVTDEHSSSFCVVHSWTVSSPDGQSPGPMHVLDCVPFEHFCVTIQDDHSLHVPTEKNIIIMIFQIFKTKNHCILVALAFFQYDIWSLNAVLNRALLSLVLPCFFKIESLKFRSEIIWSAETASGSSLDLHMFFETKSLISRSETVESNLRVILVLIKKAS